MNLSLHMNGTAVVTAPLGDIVVHDIKSSLGHFCTLPNFVTRYPEVVIKALEKIYLEYNGAFSPLVERNREWENDYRYCIYGGKFENVAVQIDMVGLTDAMLETLSRLSMEEVISLLKNSIFEIENSLAMYQLLEKQFRRDVEKSFFSLRFRTVLNHLRQTHRMPIALLAVTRSKYEGMLTSEFGKKPDEEITDAEVFELSGFDAFFSPERFARYIRENGNRCEYLLYARTSDPINKLKDSTRKNEYSLLEDATLREIIKRHAITCNIDAPDMDYRKKINDTKEYLHPMNMAYEIKGMKDIMSEHFLNVLEKRRNNRGRIDPDENLFGNFYPEDLKKFLLARGINQNAIDAGKVTLRCKPAKGTYGCYGHVSGTIADKNFRSDLKKEIHRRGHYVVQPEIPASVISNETTGETYTFIDRIFFGIIEGNPLFLGGMRNLMPQESIENKKGRIHGNSKAVYAEIVC